MRLVVHSPHTREASMRLVVPHYSHTREASMRLVVPLSTIPGRHVCASLYHTLTYPGGMYAPRCTTLTYPGGMYAPRCVQTSHTREACMRLVIPLTPEVYPGGICLPLFLTLRYTQVVYASLLP